MAQLFGIDAERVRDATVDDIRGWVTDLNEISKLLMLRRAEDDNAQRITALRAINDRLAELGVHPEHSVLGVRANPRGGYAAWSHELDAGGRLEATSGDVHLVPDLPVVMDAIAAGTLQTVSWRGSVSATARTAKSDDVEYPPEPDN